jgi:hypothetical protein
MYKNRWRAAAEDLVNLFHEEHSLNLRSVS